MSSVKRVYVEKKPEFAVAADSLLHEIREYLGLTDVTGVRILIRYDVENISEDVYRKACSVVFAEPPVDVLYEETFPLAEDETVFSVEYLPGQFDQRADSAVQCIQFLRGEEQPLIRTATTYVLKGSIGDTELESVKKLCINPVDSRETGAEKPETLVMDFPEPDDIQIFEGFTGMAEADLKALKDGTEVKPNFLDGYEIMRVMEAAIKSAETGSKVYIKD